MGFGELLRRLRVDRGMSQSKLGGRAGITARTVTRLELPGTGAPRGSTSIALLRALESEHPLSDRDRQEFLSLAGLAALANASAAVASSPASAYVDSLRSFTATLPPDEARAYWYLADLLEHTSPATILKLLETAASLAGVTLEAPVPAEDQSLTVAHPPHRLPDGTVEQTFVEYIKKADPKAARTQQVTPPKRKPAP